MQQGLVGSPVSPEGADSLDREARKALMSFFDGRSQFFVREDRVSRDPCALDDGPTAYLSRNPLNQLALRPINRHDLLHGFLHVSQRHPTGQLVESVAKLVENRVLNHEGLWLLLPR